MTTKSGCGDSSQRVGGIYERTRARETENRGYDWFGEHRLRTKVSLNFLDDIESNGRAK